MRYLKIVFMIFLFSLLWGSRRAEGHGYLVRSSPADRSVVLRAPQQVQVWFSEGLEERFSTIAVFDQTGKQVDIGDGAVDQQNPAKLVATLPDDLPPGAYLIRIRPVFTSDGHAAGDTLVFWVGQQTGSIDAEAASRRVILLEAVWRTGLILSLSVFFGTVLTYALILRPAWQNPRWQLGRLPPRIMRRLSALLWLSLLAAFAFNILALLQITMSLFDTSLSKAIGDSLWEVVVQGSNFGDVWQGRMLLLVGMLGVQIIAAQQAQNRPNSTHFLWLINGGLALIALYTLSLISHAAGATLWNNLTIFIDYLHLTSVAAWVGGLVVLAVIIRPALAPLSAEARGQALKTLLRRFSVLGMISVSLIIVTGIYASAANLYHPADLSKTDYGLTLLAKWLLILPLFGLAAFHQLLIQPERAAKLAARVQGYFPKLPQTLQLETIGALAVLSAAAVLSGTPPPTPDTSANNAISTQTLTVAGYDVTLAVSPGAVSANSYDVRLQQDGEPVEAQTVHLRFSYPRLGRYTAPLELENAEPGLWIGADGEINRAAQWDALIDFVTPQNEQIRAALHWTFQEEASLTGQRSASWLHWLSATGVIAALTLWIAPYFSHYVLRLDWSLANISISIISLGLTVAISAAGLLLINNTGESVRNLRDTPPEQVNTVFADYRSVVRGEALYEQDCATCHGDFSLRLLNASPTLITSLSDRSDEQLFRILNRGILGQHLFGTEWSEQDQWALINFLRAQERSLQ